MNDSRQHQPPAPETAAREADDAHHLPDDREHSDPSEETSTDPEPDTGAPGDDDGWLPV